MLEHPIPLSSSRARLQSASPVGMGGISLAEKPQSAQASGLSLWSFCIRVLFLSVSWLLCVAYRETEQDFQPSIVVTVMSPARFTDGSFGRR